MPQPDVPTIDLFAGAGGLSMGLAGAGLRPIVTAERDKDALATYIAAHRAFMGGGALDVREGDIGAHSFRALRGEVAVIAGGPPCQPYSLGGARRGALDERDGIPQFVRVVEEVRPQAFIMENVPGLARGRQADVLRGVVIAFEALGYHVSWRVLHAADFGVAQRRQRLVLVGSRDASFVWPVQTHGAGADRPWVRARDVLDPHQIMGVPNTAKVTYARIPDLRPSPYDGHLWNGGGRPINPDGQVPTLLASMGGNKTPWLDTLDLVPEYHSTLLAGGPPRSGEVPGARRISVDEAAIVQGFPVDMPWSGPTSSRYRQIGNAVPVRLAEAVGRAVVEHLGYEGVSRPASRLVA